MAWSFGIFLVLLLVLALALFLSSIWKAPKAQCEISRGSDLERGEMLSEEEIAHSGEGGTFVRQKPSADELVVSAFSIVDPTAFLDNSRYGLAVLKLALERSGFCVWKAGKKDEQLGDYLGVNLDWPELPKDKLESQAMEIRNILCTVAKTLRLLPVMAKPGMYAGGVMAIVCGFANEAYIAKYGRPTELPTVPPPIPGYESRPAPGPDASNDHRADEPVKDPSKKTDLPETPPDPNR